MQRIFSQIAPRYDLLNHLLSFNIDKAWRRRAIAALDWERAPTGTYVDLCAGTLDVAAAALAVTPALPVESSGPTSPNRCCGPAPERARRRSCRRSSPTRSTFPLPDDSASGAIVAFGIRNVADLDRGLREVHRVLAPGARFVILEFTTPRSADRSRACIICTSITCCLASGRSSAATARPTRTFRARSPTFPIEEDLAARMRGAGFADVQWRTLTFGVAAIHTRHQALSRRPSRST